MMQTVEQFPSCAPAAAVRAARVACVIDTLEVGGAERSLLATARRLDREQFAPVVIPVYPGAALRDEFESAGIPVYPLELPGKYAFPQGVRRLRRVLQEIQPDLIHSTLFRSNQLARVTAKSLRVPLINSLVNVPYEESRFIADPRLQRWKNRCLRLCDRATASLVTHYHAVSETVKESYCRHLGLSPERVSVIPRGRALQEAVPADVVRRLRTEFGIGAAQLTLVGVGRLTPQKGYRTLIEAMPGILNNAPGARLILVGEGPQRDELEALCREKQVAEQVTFAGQRDDVPQLLAMADLFVFPSLYEGLPGAVIEAMLAGLPIVATGIPQVRELIDDGKTGRLVAPSNPQQLAAAVADLLSSPARAGQLGLAARASAARRFDIDLVTRRMERLYHDVLEGGRARGAGSPALSGRGAVE